jgi:hypothetical protein
MRRSRGWAAAVLQIAGLLCIFGAVVGHFTGMMWNTIRVVSEGMFLAVAIWLFAATYEPLRSAAFGRHVGRRLAIAMRVTAALAAGLAWRRGERLSSVNCPR